MQGMSASGKCTQGQHKQESDLLQVLSKLSGNTALGQTIHSER